MLILTILLTTPRSRPTKHKKGQFMGCKVIVLQANRVGSRRWPCDFAYHYYLDFDVVWV